MWKKKYTTEITDAFGKDINPKQVLKLAKNIKSAQWLAYPNTEYKTKLKDRLHNMYLIDQWGEVVSRFSIFKMFGAFASFTFIAGTLLMVSDMRHDSEQIIHQDMMIEESVNINKSEQDITSIPILQEEEKEEKIQIIKKIVIEKNIPQQQETEDIFIPEAMETYKQVWEDLDETVLPVGNPGMRSEEISPEEIHYQETPQASSSMMMDYMEVWDVEQMSFRDICSEYDGMLSDDEIYCILPEWILCEEYNIYECVLDEAIIPEYEDEINLEELIEAYGQ